jgi:hypothetical protein
VPLAELSFDESVAAPRSPVADLAPSRALAVAPSMQEGDGDRTVAIAQDLHSPLAAQMPSAGTGATGPFAPPATPHVSPVAFAPRVQPEPLPAFAPPPSFGARMPVESPSGSFTFGPPPSGHTLQGGPPQAPLSAPSDPSGGFGNQSGGFGNGNQSGGFGNGNQSGGFGNGNQSGGFGNQSGGFIPNTFGATVQPASAPSVAPRRSSGKLMAFMAGLAVVAGAAVGTIFYLRSSSESGPSEAASAASTAERRAVASSAVSVQPTSSPATSSPTTTATASAPLTAPPASSATTSAAPSASAAPTSAPVLSPQKPIRPKPDAQLGY